MTDERIDYWDGGDTPNFVSGSQCYDVDKDAIDVVREQLSILADPERVHMPPQVRVDRAQRVIAALKRLTVISNT